MSGSPLTSICRKSSAARPADVCMSLSVVLTIVTFQEDLLKFFYFLDTSFPAEANTCGTQVRTMLF